MSKTTVTVECETPGEAVVVANALRFRTVLRNFLYEAVTPAAVQIKDSMQGMGLPDQQIKERINREIRDHMSVLEGYGFLGGEENGRPNE